MMKVPKATGKFENWFGKRIPIVQHDLNSKHKLMTENPLHSCGLLFTAGLKFGLMFALSLRKHRSCVHLGSGFAVNDVRRDISRRRHVWLHSAMKKMTDTVVEDYEDWCKLRS
jgi:hypothetical protein